MRRRRDLSRAGKEVGVEIGGEEEKGGSEGEREKSSGRGKRNHQEFVVGGGRGIMGC